MITKKVQALFDFIDFLHSNIELCLSQSEVFKDLQELQKKGNVLSPIDNYKNHKVLHTTLENYFYVWMPEEIPIEELIEKNKELHKTSIVITLEAAKKSRKKNINCL